MRGGRWRLGLGAAVLLAAPLVAATVLPRQASIQAQALSPDPALAALLAQARAGGLDPADLSRLQEEADRSSLPMSMGRGPGTEAVAAEIALAIHVQVGRRQAAGNQALSQAEDALRQARTDGLDADTANTLAAGIREVRVLLLSAETPLAADAQVTSAQADLKLARAAAAQALADRQQAERVAHDEDVRAAGDAARVVGDFTSTLDQAGDELNAAAAVQAQGPRDSRPAVADTGLRSAHVRALIDAARLAGAPPDPYSGALQAYGRAALIEQQAASVLVASAPGKLVTVSLAEQQVRAFDAGHEILSSIATTGRPGLETDAGTYHIYARYSPFVMRSPWPHNSPYWYPDSPISFAMFFNGGDALHDAPWRSNWGPGSNFGQDGEPGTHGCVNVPYNSAAALFRWAEVGTQVTVY